MNKNKKAKIFFRQANRRGSVLAFTLIVMFIFLVIAIGIANVSVKEIKMSSDTGKSATAFQAADSGMEIVLEKMKEGPYTTVNELATAGGMSCSNGIISDTLASGGEYELTFEDAGDIISDCADADPIIKIKSLGKYSGINRAVEVDL